MIGHHYELFDLIRISIVLTMVLLFLVAWVICDWLLDQRPPPVRDEPILHLTGEQREIDQ